MRSNVPSQSHSMKYVVLRSGAYVRRIFRNAKTTRLTRRVISRAAADVGSGAEFPTYRRNAESVETCQKRHFAVQRRPLFDQFVGSPNANAISVE